VYESEPKRRSLILLETDLDAKDDHNDVKKSEVEVEEISPAPGEEAIKSELPESPVPAAGEEEDDGEWEWEYEEEEEEEEKAPEEGAIKPEKSPSPTVISSSYKTTAV
jgi:SET domain-containing protein